MRKKTLFMLVVGWPRQAFVILFSPSISSWNTIWSIIVIFNHYLERGYYWLFEYMKHMDALMNTLEKAAHVDIGSTMKLILCLIALPDY